MTAPLWSGTDLAAAVGTKPDGVVPPDITDITDISIDSRTLAPGACFFAIKGANFDGHDFVDAAFDAGAAAAVVSRDWATGQGDADRPLFIVNDVLDGLSRVAIAARARTDARIVAVTGSVGKTGTKEMLAAALAPDGPVHASPRSFNNHWGVPLTLARMPAASAYGVFEIGMNHAGEITPLTRLVRPHVAIVTTVEAVHLENFADEDGIARAKAEIFKGLEPDGVALINRDNRHVQRLEAEAKAAGVGRIATFGEHAEADIRLLEVVPSEQGTTVAASVFGVDVAYRLAVPGRHLVQNSLASLGAVAALGGDLARGALALADLAAPEGRGRPHRLRVGHGEVLLIDESYNANPASMRAAIAVLGLTAPGPSGRRIVVFGDMLELGDDSPAMHAGLVPDLEQAAVDRVYAAGPLMAALWKVLPSHLRGGYAETAAELERQVIDDLAAGDVVMVKGSNGSRLGPLVASLKAHFEPLDTGSLAPAREHA